MKIARLFLFGPAAILIEALGCSSSSAPGTATDSGADGSMAADGSMVTDASMGTDGSMVTDDAQTDAEPRSDAEPNQCVHTSDCPVNTGASCASVCADGSNPCVNACIAGRCAARGCPDGGAEAAVDAQSSACDALDASKPQCVHGGPCSCDDQTAHNGTPVCVSGAWQCPSGYTRFEDCHGVPPHGDGGDCLDASSDAHAE